MILLVIIGFVSKSLYNVPFSLMALLGLYRAIKAPARLWADPFQRHYIWLFLCLWLPLLCSLPEAANSARAAQTVFPYLRFLFAGLFIIQELSGKPKADRLYPCRCLFLRAVLVRGCLPAILPGAEHSRLSLPGWRYHRHVLSEKHYFTHLRDPVRGFVFFIF